MLKKMLIATTVLAATSSIALANGAPYVGASIGVNNTNAKISSNSTTLQGGSNSDSYDVGARGALMNIFAGYGATVNQTVYLGGEVFASAANFEASNKSNFKSDDGSVDNSNQSLRTKYSIGADFIPGVKVSEHTMVYGRVGIVDTRFDVHGASTETNANLGTSSSFTQNDNRVGGRLGAGIQTSLTQNWDVRAEYVYTGYRSYKVMGSNVKPSTDQFTVGLVYKID